MDEENEIIAAIKTAIHVLHGAASYVPIRTLTRPDIPETIRQLERALALMKPRVVPMQVIYKENA